ncbi:MAG: tetratricopeptide repeat protein [Lewinellaceae bacterium]|nr:tetratricopeptide repeat protein [Lewinellaceae bacterium]
MKTYPACIRLTTLLLFANIAVSTAQKQGLQRIDSLKTELSKSTEDTARVKLLSHLAYGYSQIDMEVSQQYASQTLALAKRLNWEKGIGYAKEVIGRNHWQNGEFAQALNYHFEALAIWKKLGIQDKIAMVNLFIAQDYADDGNYFEALKYLPVALKGYEKIGNLYNQSVVHNIFAWVYSNLGMHPEWLKHSYAALKIFEDAGDQAGYAVISSNLANNLEEQGNYAEAIKIYLKSIKSLKEADDFINESLSYNDLGRCYSKTGNYSEALKQHQIAYEKGRKIKNHTCMGRSYSGVGDVYVAPNNYNTALKNYLLAAESFRAVSNTPSLAGLYSKIGDCYVKLGDMGAAKHYFDRAFSLIEKMESIGEMNFYYKGIMQLDSATGNWQKAFEHLKRYTATRDSMHNKENTKKMVQIRMQYEFDKKTAQEKAAQERKDAQVKQELQKQKLIRNGFMGGFVVVMLFAGIVFYQRNKIKKGKKRSDELLLNILPAEVAEELKAKGSAAARMIDEVTVLFSDFKDFTQLSETLTPNELVAEINECFSAFDLIMQKHGVEKIKTVGDAYLAAGGLPSPNDTHAINVLNAALEMQTFMEQRKRIREAAGKFFFEARIGVHTGPVVAGIVGIKKFAYDIWGDTVNTAQRMESSGEAGKVNISGSTYELIKKQFQCVYRGMISTKGKGEVGMYFVGSPVEGE